MIILAIRHSATTLGTRHSVTDLGTHHSAVALRTHHSTSSLGTHHLVASVGTYHSLAALVTHHSVVSLRMPNSVATLVTCLSDVCCKQPFHQIDHGINIKVSKLFSKNIGILLMNKCDFIKNPREKLIKKLEKKKCRPV